MRSIEVFGRDVPVTWAMAERVSEAFADPFAVAFDMNAAAHAMERGQAYEPKYKLESLMTCVDIIAAAADEDAEKIGQEAIEHGLSETMDQALKIIFAICGQGEAEDTGKKRKPRQSGKKS